RERNRIHGNDALLAFAKDTTDLLEFNLSHQTPILDRRRAVMLVGAGAAGGARPRPPPPASANRPRCGHGRQVPNPVPAVCTGRSQRDSAGGTCSRWAG